MRIRPGSLKDAGAISKAGLRFNTRTAPEQMVVAENEAGEVSGFAYCFRSRLHPSRYWATVRVCEDQRRQGLGTKLLQELAPLREAESPFYAMLRTDNPSLKWVEALGGRLYQESPPMKLDLLDPATREWIEGLPTEPIDGGVRVERGQDVDVERLLEAWIDMYEWKHADWQPAASRGAIENVYREEILHDLDLDLTSVALDGDRVLAAAFVFTTPNTDPHEPLDAVIEATDPADPASAVAVAAVLRRTAVEAAAAGWECLGIDGYQTDTHLFPLVMSAPKRVGHHLVWLEYDAPPSE